LAAIDRQLPVHLRYATARVAKRSVRDSLRADAKRDSAGFVGGILKKMGPKSKLFSSTGLGARECFEARQTRQNVLNRVGV